MTELMCVDCLVDRNSGVPAITLMHGNAYCGACATEHRRLEEMALEESERRMRATEEVRQRMHNDYPGIF